MRKSEPLQLFFVHGPPRAGVDLLMDFLTAPRQTAWVSEALAAKPERLTLARKVNRLNWPLLGEFYLERRFDWKSVPAPAMTPGFWEHYLQAFTPPPENPFLPGPEHLLEGEAERLRDAVEELCWRQRRRILVAAYTGIPRVRLLRTVFPQAKFLQLQREPKSVAYHLVRKIEGANRHLWEHREKWTALMPEALQTRLRELAPTPLNYCGVLVRWMQNLYRGEQQALPETAWREVAYSDLLAKPMPTLEKSLQFLGLQADARFRYFVKFHDIQISNLRTNRNLRDEESDQLAIAVAPL